MGSKRGDLIDVSCHLQIPRCYGTSEPPEKGGLEIGPTRNQDRPEQNQNSSSIPSRGHWPLILSSV